MLLSELEETHLYSQGHPHTWQPLSPWSAGKKQQFNYADLVSTKCHIAFIICEWTVSAFSCQQQKNKATYREREDWRKECPFVVSRELGENAIQNRGKLPKEQKVRIVSIPFVKEDGLHVWEPLFSPFSMFCSCSIFVVSFIVTIKKH